MCRAEEIKKADEERRQAEKMRRVRDMRRIGFPDDEMQNWTFDRDDNTNEKVSRVMHNYVDKFEQMRKDGKGLLLYGKVGTGKTFASACVANALIDKGYPCLMTSFARLRNTLQGMFDGRQQYIDGLNRFDLIIIDDLGSEADTEFMGEVVQNIIDSRYRAGLPLIVTTNLTGEQLKHPTDIRKQRIYSRLLEMCIPLEVTGTDRRKKKLTDQYKGYADLLGL
jgi:DNA replication protein DnaC